MGSGSHLAGEADDEEHGAAEEDPVLDQEPLHGGDQHGHQGGGLLLLRWNAPHGAPLNSGDITRIIHLETNPEHQQHGGIMIRSPK